jgi:hypothetical protein
MAKAEGIIFAITAVGGYGSGVRRDDAEILSRQRLMEPAKPEVRRSGRLGLQLADDHRLKRVDRLKILRRDLRLRDRQIEFGFDAEHQIDHVHRRQPDIHQPRFRTDFCSNRVLLEDGLDQIKDPIPNVGVEALHLRLSTCRRVVGPSRTELAYNPACSGKQRAAVVDNLHFVLNANGNQQGFCDRKHRGLTVNVETTVVYPEFHRRI